MGTDIKANRFPVNNFKQLHQGPISAYFLFSLINKDFASIFPTPSTSNLTFFQTRTNILNHKNKYTHKVTKIKDNKNINVNLFGRTKFPFPFVNTLTTDMRERRQFDN